MKKKLLFIRSNNINDNTGGSRRSNQNYSGCSAIFECTQYLASYDKRRIIRYYDILINGLWGISKKQIDEIIGLLNDGEFDYVFLDNSLYGKLALIIKKHFSEIKVITHYHNFEKQFQLDSMQFNKSIKKRIITAICLKNEKIASKISDYCMFISEEDMKAVFKEYELNKKASVTPVLLDDKYDEKEYSSKKPYVLFLGSDFYANQEAAEFLIKNVAPYVNCKVVIAGKGMKSIFNDSYKNVEVFDFVPSLSELMGGACAFISPIFSGSGAKIKIAEALMHGKYIIATEQSFAGYNFSEMDAKLCRTAEDFIESVNKLNKNRVFYKKNRDLFLNNHNMNINENYYRCLLDI